MSTIAPLSITFQVTISFSDGAQVDPIVLRAIEAATARFAQLAATSATQPLTGPGELLRLEQELHALVPRECIDQITGALIVAAVDDPVVQMKASRLLDSMGRHLRLQAGSQKAAINLLGGGTVTVWTPYYLSRRHRGRPRQSRGKSGNGIYPVLAALGIHERLTPAYGSLIAMTVVRGSLDDAREELARRGVLRDKKAIMRVVRIVTQRSLKHQQWLDEGGASEHPPAWNLEGKRIGITVDGGRLRTRTKKRGRKRKSGGKSFGTDWRDPRVIVVYELDDRGRKSRLGYVRYDATIADADATFERMTSILTEVGATAASMWVILADGAEWIWERAKGVAAKLGYDPAKVIEVVDFFHAVEYLSDFAVLLPRWTENQRRTWIQRVKRHLKRGANEKVIEAMREHCRGRNAHKMAVVIDRFVRNAERMRYAYLKAHKFPCGSGVVESAVRRIVNLRLKGPGIFWKLETAEGLLHLRARYLSGDWDAYIARIFEPEAMWSSNPARQPAVTALNLYRQDKGHATHIQGLGLAA